MYYEGPVYGQAQYNEMLYASLYISKILNCFALACKIDEIIKYLSMIFRYVSFVNLFHHIAIVIYSNDCLCSFI